MFRVFVNVLLFLSILFLPWWCTAALAVAALFLFRHFYEALFWGFVFDILYGGTFSALYGFRFVALVSVLTVYCAFELIKSRTRVYAR